MSGMYSRGGAAVNIIFSPIISSRNFIKFRNGGNTENYDARSQLDTTITLRHSNTSG